MHLCECVCNCVNEACSKKYPGGSVRVVKHYMRKSRAENTFILLLTYLNSPTPH